jgi:hypothetical protein
MPWSSKYVGVNSKGTIEKRYGSFINNRKNSIDDGDDEDVNVFTSSLFAYLDCLGFGELHYREALENFELDELKLHSIVKEGRLDAFVTTHMRPLEKSHKRALVYTLRMFAASSSPIPTVGVDGSLIVGDSGKKVIKTHVGPFHKNDIKIVLDAESGNNPLATSVVLKDPVRYLAAVCFEGCATLLKLILHDNSILTLCYKPLIVKFDINFRSCAGMTCLMWASLLGNYECVELLLKHAANVDLRDSMGMTALMFSSMSGHADIIKLLIDHGADIDGETYDKVC